MVFINGQQIKGYGVFAEDAIATAVTALAETDPVPATAAADSPPTAVEKYIDDWRGQPVRRVPARALPADVEDWQLGPANTELPAVRIVLWGDLREPRSALLDARMRSIAREHTVVSYEFRFFPLEENCNPGMPRTVYPGACAAALTAAAAGLIGGAETYWPVHDWLMAHQGAPAADALYGAATAGGLEPGELAAARLLPEAAALITADAAAASGLALRGVPHLVIGGKWVPRWNLAGESIPERIVAELIAGTAHAE
jgi:protein-disulfide isomerase